jgi:hypothetical protein
MGSEECMSGKAIYQNFMDGRGTDPLMESQRSIGTVSDFYEERVSQIKRLAVSMEEGWTGNASGAAQRGAGPLAEAHARASVEMKTAKELLTRQTESYGVAHGNVVDVPDLPKEPSLFKKVVTLGGAQDSYEDKVEASNAANQRNIAVMGQWADASSVNGAMMPTDYGNISTKDVTVGVKEEPVVPPWPPIWPPEKWPPDLVKIDDSGDDDDDDDSGDDGGKKIIGNGDDRTIGTDDDKVGPDDKVVRPPLPDRPILIDNELLPPPRDDDWRNTFPDQTDKPDPGKPPISGGKDELTRPEDFTPEKPADRPGWNLPGGPGGPGGTGITGGTSGTGQGSSSGTGFGPLGGFGGSGAGSGAGSGSGSGGGRFGGGGSGTGGAGGLGGEKSLGGRGAGSASGAAEAMGRRGAAGARGMGGGAAGRPGGAGGMPGMGAGQKGQGGEDEEHQRKYIVDDDEAFQLADDGERLTDPRTGMPLAPPVIGE